MRLVLLVVASWMLALCTRPAGAQALESDFVFGRDYTFERQVATRRLADAQDRGVVRLVTYVYRPTQYDRHEVVLFSHGSTGGLQRSPQEPGGSNAPPASVIQFFVSRGYTVVAPMRRGRGESGGHYVEECSVYTGECTVGGQLALTDRALREALLDTHAVIDQLVLGRLVPRASKLLLVGHSRGGFLSLLLAAERAKAVRAVVNFAGGWHGITARLPAEAARQRGADHALRLERAARRAEVPTLWLYATGDPLYVDGLPQEMHAHWTKAGGAGVVRPAASAGARQPALGHQRSATLARARRGVPGPACRGALSEHEGRKATVGVHVSPGRPLNHPHSSDTAATATKHVSLQVGSRSRVIASAPWPKSP